jgi:hypothetical protein
MVGTVEFEDIVLDAETTSLLNDSAIDYTASPYRLKPDFKLHCIFIEEYSTGEIIGFHDGPKYIFDGRGYEEEIDGITYYLEEGYEPVDYTHKPLDKFPEYIKTKRIRKIIGHNIINFDLLVFKLWFGMDYEIGPDIWHGQKVDIHDTLVVSKTLNPDRYPNHKLETLAERAGGAKKFEFRKHIPEDQRFKHFAADMAYYNIFDTKSNRDVFEYLEHERTHDGWDWDDAIELEKAVAEIATRQEHRGFKFNEKLAESNVRELDALMEERRVRVEPLLPPRPATKKFMQEHTPPAQQQKITEITAPKRPLLSNGRPSKKMLEFVEDHGGELEDRVDGYYYTRGDLEWYVLPTPKEEDPPVLWEEYDISNHMWKFLAKHGGKASRDRTKVRLFGETYTLPMDRIPLKLEMQATIDDTTHIKNWLVGLGWSPSEYKEKDISVKSGPKKEKRTEEELVEAVDRYVEETLLSNFRDDRMAHLEVSERNFKRKLLTRAAKRSCKVLTNPSFTVGQEKELCRDLDRVAEEFPYVKDVVEYLTYKHRRNSILGGGLEWEEGEEEAEKGYIANIRSDGRIPTPVDTCGAATARMKHRVVANIPRVTSLYGDKMRALFGTDSNELQIGYDFDSLEARIESHYCWDYDDAENSYCKSLLLPKPNDTHSALARKVSAVLGREFGRTPAKSVRYGCAYGAQPPKVAKTIGCSLEEGTIVFDTFWELASPLKLMTDDVVSYWKHVANKKYIVGIDGRKVPTRAEHAIRNTLFQSGGVICAKRAAVFHDRLMKKEGLQVDFFKDDWKNIEFCQQMIMYHDEAQLEESLSRFKFKLFETKEAANDYRDNAERVWGEPAKGKNGQWVLAWSRASELIQEAVTMTSEYYKLNVPLTAGYIVGNNWRDCH